MAIPQLADSSATNEISSTPLCVNPLDNCQDDLIKEVEKRAANRRYMLLLIKRELVEGVDYGSILVYDKKKKREVPTKPFLFKSGTIKIVSILGLTIVYHNIDLYEQLAISGQEIGDIILRCQLFLGDNLVAEGVGARSKIQDVKGNSSFGFRDIHKAIAMAKKGALYQAVYAIPYILELFVDQQSQEQAPQSQQELAPQSQQELAPQSQRQITVLEYETLRQAKLGLSFEHQSKLDAWLSKKGYDNLTQISFDVYSFLMTRINNLGKTGGK